MTAQLLATPFHARVADANRFNAWENRGGFTLASSYGEVEEEALAARFGAVLIDISWQWRVEISGARAAEFVARYFTRNIAALGVGAALEALWLNDAGAVRGSGTVLRTAQGSFLLVAPLEDRGWLESAAGLFGVGIADHTEAEAVLALIGPAVGKILAAAGLDANLPPLRRVQQDWRGISVSVSRLGLGFEIWCAPDDALIVWDRLQAAGRAFALMPAGLQALDILEFESGILRPGRDYQPARDGFVPQPSAQALGLCALVDRAHFFNGRAGHLDAGPETGLCGILLDTADPPQPGTVLTAESRTPGRILCARYTPALKSAAALAVFENVSPGTLVRCGDVPGRAVALPFLPVPSATEAGTSAV